MSVTVNGSNGLTFNDGSTQATAPKVGMVNRIINGDFRIDQRNAGASSSFDGTSGYTVDRWVAQETTSTGSFTVQQSSTAPTGFINSLLLTVTAADATLDASDRNTIKQPIEGLNVADLGWGTANASTVTLSFWVRSSVTGTFGGAFTNSAGNRSYPFSYTISSANTFEQKTITVAGDTSGTWLTTNGLGINVWFAIGCGTDYTGTANTWAGAGYRSATGSTNLMATNGATFYITGVQLEKGSTATSFDYRPYGTELALCQRYYENIGGTTGTGDIVIGMYASGTSQYAYVSYPFAVVKRASPTVTKVGTWTAVNTNQPEVNNPSTWGFRAYTQSTSSGAMFYAQNNVSGAYFNASAEL